MRAIHVCAFRGRIHSVTGVKRPSASVLFHGVLLLLGRCSRERSAERSFPPWQVVLPRMWSERDAYFVRGVSFPRQRMEAECFDSVKTADKDYPFEVVVRSLTRHLRFPRSAAVSVGGISGFEKGTVLLISEPVYRAPFAESRGGESPLTPALTSSIPLGSRVFRRTLNDPFSRAERVSPEQSRRSHGSANAFSRRTGIGWIRFSSVRAFCLFPFLVEAVQKQARCSSRCCVPATIPGSVSADSHDPLP